MKILFLSSYYYPHIGGVEKHVEQVCLELNKIGHEITLITEKYSKDLDAKEKKGKLRIIRIQYPHIKFFGLFFIWIWLLRNNRLIRNAKIVHCHDVFVWYLPFRFIFPHKKVYTTFHGWEGKYPIPLKNIFLKKLAWKLSSGSICVGKYIEKYYGIKTNIITYGAVATTREKIVKDKNKYIYVGRLSKDTGLTKFLSIIKKKKVHVDFFGDGPLRDACEVYGTVHGFSDPKTWLSKAYICFASGYLTALEAMTSKCEVKVAWDNPLKKDYWQMAPFYKFIRENNLKRAYEWAKTQTWRKLANHYLKLWGTSDMDKI